MKISIGVRKLTSRKLWMVMNWNPRSSWRWFTFWLLRTMTSQVSWRRSQRRRKSQLTRTVETAIKNVDFAHPVQVSWFCMSGERFLDQSIWPNTLEFGEQMKFAIDLPAGSWAHWWGQMEAIPLNLLRSLNEGFGKENVILTDQQHFNLFQVTDEKVTDDQFQVVASEYLHLYLKTKKTPLEAMDVKEAMRDFGRRFENPIFQNKWDELAIRQEKWDDLVQIFLAQVEFAQAVTGPPSINKVSVRSRWVYEDSRETREGGSKETPNLFSLWMKWDGRWLSALEGTTASSTERVTIRAWNASG